MTDDRESFRVARIAGKAAAHEKRLESATYTAAEVKVLTETASKVAYALGRKDALEEAAVWIEDYHGPNPSPASPAWWAGYTEAQRDCARMVRELPPQPSPDATSGRTDPEEAT